MYSKYIIIAILAVMMSMIPAASGIIAQDSADPEEASAVILELTTGTTIEGYVNDWVIGEYIDIRTAWNESIVLPSSIIERVIQKSTLETSFLNSYRFRETGVYYSGKLQLIAGNEGQRAKAVNGLGFSISAGYRFNRWASVGLGSGYDRFIWNSGENFIPVFAEYTCFFNPKNTSLFTSIQAGYSFAYKDNDFLLIEAKGGAMVYPAIGLRFGRYDTKYTIDFGYKFQKAELTYTDQWQPARSEQRLTYRRLTLRFGILL